jgi:hypothetical protein
MKMKTNCRRYILSKNIILLTPLNNLGVLPLNYKNRRSPIGSFKTLLKNNKEHKMKKMASIY